MLAAGDCVITHHRLLGETYLPLGATAHKQGRVADENALGGNRCISPAASAPRWWDTSKQAAAQTGLRDHEAKAAGLNSVTVGSAADDHKVYYPGSHRITMRVTGDRTTGRLLGARVHLTGPVIARILLGQISHWNDPAIAALNPGITLPGRRSP